MAKQNDFDETMQPVFAGGVSDMKVFMPMVRQATVDELQADVVAFQKAINEGRSRPVAAVD